MSINEVKEFLIWGTVIHVGLLLLWLGVFAFARDWIYGIQSRWFKLSAETFDVMHFFGVAIYKVGILIFYVVPLIVLAIIF